MKIYLENKNPRTSPSTLHPQLPTLSGWEALGGCWKVRRCRPGRKLWVTQASRDVTKTGAGPHQPTVPEICSPRQWACSIRTGGGVSVGCSTAPSHTFTGHSPGRGRQLSLCTHQPRAPGPRGGAAGLLKARQAWQSPRRRPRPRQLAARHCRKGRGQGSLFTRAYEIWKGLWI